MFSFYLFKQGCRSIVYLCFKSRLRVFLIFCYSPARFLWARNSVILICLLSVVILQFLTNKNNNWHSFVSALTTAIQEAFPRMIALRKQNERKTLNKSYPLPGDALNTPMSTWFNHMLRGHTRRHNTMGLHHSGLRGRQEFGVMWQIGAACLLMTTLVGMTGVFLFSIMLYSWLQYCTTSAVNFTNQPLPSLRNILRT